MPQFRDAWCVLFCRFKKPGQNNYYPDHIKKWSSEKYTSVSHINNNERNGFSVYRNIQALILNQASLPCDNVRDPLANNSVIWWFLFYSQCKFHFKSFLIESNHYLKELIFFTEHWCGQKFKQRKMLVKGPDEVGPFSCQKADLAGSHILPWEGNHGVH